MKSRRCLLKLALNGAFPLILIHSVFARQAFNNSGCSGKISENEIISFLYLLSVEIVVFRLDAKFNNMEL